MSRRYLEEEVEDREALSGILQDQPGLLFVYIPAGLALMLVIYFVLRDFVFHNGGYNDCPVQRQTLEDERLAMESLQLEMKEEDRQDKINLRRLERRRKYEQFLPPYTMVVKSDDFCYAIEKEDGSKEIRPMVSKDALPEYGGDAPQKEEGAPNDIDVEAANHMLSEQHNHEHLLKLPVKAANGEPRYVDVSCSVCLLDYEAGDTIIRSTRKVCSHVFHDDCILLWLSKGKKRCPVCRNFFVPGSSIDDKKVITHDEGDLEAERNDQHYLFDDEEDIDVEKDALAAVQEVDHAVKCDPAQDTLDSILLIE